MPLTLEQISQATQAAFGRLSADVGKISSDVDAGFRARKEKEAAFEATQRELQARVLETEQVLARRGQPGAGAAYVDASASLGGLAAGIIEGLGNSNSVRLSAPTASAKRLAAFRAATLTGADLPGVPLPAVSVYHPALAGLIDLLQARPVKSGNSVSFVRVDYSADSPGGKSGGEAIERRRAKGGIRHRHHARRSTARDVRALCQDV